MTEAGTGPHIGLFGGTFDPPHAGHLIVAQDAALALGLDRILFVPAARPPHKRGESVTAPALRAEMLSRAIGGDHRFSMDTLELDRAGASYTVDTLRELAGRDPAARWTLLIGADQYGEFHTWREPDAIRSLARIAVVMRAGTDGAGDAVDTAGTGGGDVSARTAASRSAGGTGGPGGSSARLAVADLFRPRVRELEQGDVALEVTRIDISATAVRGRVAAGLPIRYLVPRAVEEFIFEHRLYTRNGTPVTG